MYREFLPQSDGRRVGKKLKKDTIKAWSAGVEIHGLNPDAVKVMAEAGIDISGHLSKHIDEFKEMELGFPDDAYHMGKILISNVKDDNDH